ncbi:hypothetical protein ACOMHN_012750 [Nucella lapillus]
MATSKVRRVPLTPGAVCVLVVALMVPQGSRAQQNCDAVYRSGSRLVIPAGAQCHLPPGHYTYTSLQVNGTLLARTSGSSGVTLTADWMTVSPAGRVRSDGQGPGPGEGAGAGSTDGSGGAHGGRGGQPGGSFLTSSQSRPHGSLQSPVTSGGGGGGQQSCGGAGGGVLRLTLAASLRVDGVISVEGGGGGQGGCGGGAGGSVHVTTSLLQGAGLVLAAGGRGGSGGSGRGGGGGGGRITFTYNVTRFTGHVLAHGGLGGGMEVLIPSLGQAVSSAQSGHSNGLLDPSRYPSRSWRPASSPTPHYLELRPPAQQGYYVTGLETRGGVTSTDYVTKYSLHVYDDTLKNWRIMLDSDYTEEIPGNTDQSGMVRRRLVHPVLTSKVRIYPLTWTGAVALTARLYGYRAGGGGDSVTVAMVGCVQVGRAGGGDSVTVAMVGCVQVGGDSVTVAMVGCVQMGGDSVTDAMVGWGGDSATVAMVGCVQVGWGQCYCCYGGVCAGGAGGAGTVFWAQQGSAAVGRLRLDNLAQRAELRVTDSDIDLNRTGAATWLLDTTSDLDVITLRNSAILYMDINVAVSDVDTDDTSLVYVSRGRSLRVGNGFDGNKFVAASAILQLARDSEVTLDKWSYVMGTLHLQGDTKLTVGGNMTLRPQPLTLDSLTLTQGSTLHVQNTSLFPLTLSSLTLNGNFTASTVHLSALTAFTTGPRSNVSFDPVPPSLGGRVTIEGVVHLHSPVSFSNCSALTIGGALTWSGNDSVTLDCSTVTVTGRLTPTHSPLVWGRNVRHTVVGAGGRLVFRAGGPLLTHSLTVGGLLEVRNKVTLQSPVQGLSKMTALTIQGPGGKVVLDSGSLPVVGEGAALPAVNHSRIFVDVLTVGGLFQAGRLMFGERVTNVTVASGGNFTLDPANALHVDYLTCHGVLTSLTPLEVRGHSVIRTRALHVGENGTLTLDATAQARGNYSGVSALVAEVVRVEGVLSAGRLTNHLPPLQHGWNHLQVGPKGRLTFRPTDTLYLGYVEVAGLLESPTPLTIRPPPSYDVSANRVVVAAGGTVKLGTSLPSPLSNLIHCGRLHIHPGGTMDVGYQRPTPGGQTVSPASVLTVREVVVGGTLRGDVVRVVADDVSVGGQMTAVGGGHLTNKGPGASGASHGGRGGRGSTSSPFTLAPLPYGTIFQADQAGSGGGGTSVSGGGGGRGGGVIHLVIAGNLVVNGAVRVDGLDATVRPCWRLFVGLCVVYYRCLTHTSFPFIRHVLLTHTSFPFIRHDLLTHTSIPFIRHDLLTHTSFPFIRHDLLTHTSFPFIRHVLLTHTSFPFIRYDLLTHTSFPSIRHDLLTHTSFPSIRHDLLIHTSFPFIRHDLLIHTSFPFIRHDLLIHTSFPFIRHDLLIHTSFPSIRHDMLIHTSFPFIRHDLLTHTSFPFIRHDLLTHTSFPFIRHDLLTHTLFPSIRHDLLTHTSFPSIRHDLLTHTSFPFIRHDLLTHTSFPSIRHDLLIHTSFPFIRHDLLIHTSFPFIRHDLLTHTSFPFIRHDLLTHTSFQFICHDLLTHTSLPFIHHELLTHTSFPFIRHDLLPHTSFPFIRHDLLTHTSFPFIRHDLLTHTSFPFIRHDLLTHTSFPFIRHDLLTHTSFPFIRHDLLTHTSFPFIRHDLLTHTSFPSICHDLLTHTSFPSIRHDLLTHTSFPSIRHDMLTHTSFPSIRHDLLTHTSFPFIRHDLLIHTSFPSICHDLLTHTSFPFIRHDLLIHTSFPFIRYDLLTHTSFPFIRHDLLIHTSFPFIRHDLLTHTSFPFIRHDLLIHTSFPFIRHDLLTHTSFPSIRHDLLTHTSFPFIRHDLLTHTSFPFIRHDLLIHTSFPFIRHDLLTHTSFPFIRHDLLIHTSFPFIRHDLLTHTSFPFIRHDLLIHTSFPFIRHDLLIHTSFPFIRHDLLTHTSFPFIRHDLLIHTSFPFIRHDLLTHTSFPFIRHDLLTHTSFPFIRHDLLTHTSFPFIRHDLLTHTSFPSIRHELLIDTSFPFIRHDLLIHTPFPFIRHVLLVSLSLSDPHVVPQATHGGGGSGGSVRVRCSTFSGSGSISSNGGGGLGGGGGGAGGRVLVNFTTGSFRSGHVAAHGGSGAEPGGPGLIYLHGDNIRNLRVDNRCQQPQVTEHGGTWADEASYLAYLATGAIAYLLPPAPHFTYDFTIMEIYGAAHLALSGNHTKVRAVQIVGDDTGHLHVPPGNTLDWTQESMYQRANMTWQLFLYRGAELILPPAPVEIRAPLIHPAPCPTPLLRPSVLRVWGTLTGHRARLLIGSGQTISMELSAPRHLTFSSVTVQDGAHWTFASHHGNASDRWLVTVRG